MSRAKILGLYKKFLRMTDGLPKDLRSYYRNYARTQFVGHADETDPQRIKQLIEHGWVSENAYRFVSFRFSYLACIEECTYLLVGLFTSIRLLSTTRVFKGV
eukprot:TRINITY_DN8725_c0_g1_i2.p1 TRINITY_DN8725_c0_g1~~TRINITY_DN8725_c0_g1_i2.p1  ORF type:complete len:102 (+),score=9.54 TRINITY_DN8725_c0_g1_i2:39-344(+)